MAAYVSMDGLAERNAFLALALGRRSRSHRARRFAREAEADGNLRLCREWTAVADEMWRKAKHALALARREVEFNSSTGEPE